MKPKLLSRNPFDPDRPLAKYPRIHRGMSEITVKLVKFKLPSDELREKYEAKKKEYMEKRFKEFQEELNVLDEGKILMKNGNPAIKLKCDECGYEWEYSGRRTVARCPNCEHRVYVAEMESRETGTNLKCRHCGYEWTYTGGANRTICPNCESYVNTIKDIPEKNHKEDPLDPMNTQAWKGMTKEEIFDIMVSKFIREGREITPGMKHTLEWMSERTAKHIQKKEQDDDKEQQRKDGE